LFRKMVAISCGSRGQSAKLLNVEVCGTYSKTSLIRSNLGGVR
jgi:hypothetical protein